MRSAARRVAFQQEVAAVEQADLGAGASSAKASAPSGAKMGSLRPQTASTRTLLSCSQACSAGYSGGLLA
jgi:hypothetical protein